MDDRDFISQGPRQANDAGAKQAAGEIFLFLRSDTRLPARGLSKIREAMEVGTAAGRFTMRFDHSHWLLKLFALYTRLSCFSYGDQGFFVRRDVFQHLAGFREDIPFEDVDFYKRLSAVTRPVILKDPVVTSAQRFLEGSGKREKWLRFLLVGLHYMGFKISHLKHKPHSF